VGEAEIERDHSLPISLAISEHGFSFALGFVAGSGFQFAFAHTVGSAFKDGDVGVMGEAVEKRRDAGGIGKTVFQSLKTLLVVSKMALRS